MWITPEYQNKGLGKTAFELLFKKSNGKTLWRLETPDWAVRNQYFYESIGFRKTGVTPFNKYCGWKEFKYSTIK